MRFLKIFTLVVFCLSSVMCASAQRKAKYTYKTSRNYEVAMLGVGADGTKVFKIFTTEKNVEKAIALGKKAAVEVCLFRGLPSAGTVNSTPALCDSECEEAHEDYFDEFFTPGGRYLRYVNLTTDGMPSGQDRLKIKGGWKVGLSVQIMYDQLRKDLEKDGIIKGLSYGF